MRHSMWWSLQNQQSKYQFLQGIRPIFADSQHKNRGRQFYLQLRSAAMFETTEVQQTLDTIYSHAC